MRTGRDSAAAARSTRALAIIAIVCLASSARAQSSAPSASGPDEQRRTALYTEGFDAATAGRWAEAKDRFAEALAIRASAKVYFSLAQAEEQLGQLASASRDYKHALEDARAAGENDVASAAGGALAALEPRVPRVRVVVTGASGAVATLDGQTVAVNTPIAVDPGAYHIVVSAPGKREAQATVAVGERQQLDVPLRLEEEASANSTSSGATEAAGPSTQRTSFPWRTVGLVTAGAGLVALGVGTYFGLDAKSKNDQSNSSGCNASNNDCTPSAAAIRRDAITAGNTSTVLFVVGGVLAAGGVALWLLAPAPQADGAVGVSAAPLIVPGGAGLSLSTGWW
jgi:PEGA domain